MAAAGLLAEEGVELAAAGDYDRAAGCFERSLAVADDATVRCNYGVSLERLGRLAAAIDAYEAASTLAPEDPVPRVNCGDALVRAGRVGEATQCYLDALARPTPPSEPWAVVNNLGVAYERLGEVENAVLAYREAARLHPRYAKPRESLRRILAETPEALGAAVLPPARAEALVEKPPASLLDSWLACACICAPSPTSPDANAAAARPLSSPPPDFRSWPADEPPAP